MTRTKTVASSAAPLLVLITLGLIFVGTQPPVCASYERQGSAPPTINWNRVYNSSQEMACFTRLASDLSQDELADWFRANGFSVRVFPISQIADIGEIVSITWPWHKKGSLSWASFLNPFVYSQAISFQYDNGAAQPMIRSSYTYE